MPTGLASASAFRARQWTALLASWHEGTCYVIDDNADGIPVAVGADWLKRCMTLFADDIVLSGSFSSAGELHAELKKIGLVLDAIESMGLTICDQKSHALFSIGGTAFAKTQAKVQRKGEHGMQLLIPRRNRPPTPIPITDRVKYLGVIISFGALEQYTIDHRIHCAFSCRRLSRWLYNRRLNITAKLHL